jgi:opacity protein-like surface antigen
VAAQEVGRAEVSGGWKMLRTTEEDAEQTFTKGWYVDLATNVNDYIAIVNEVAGAYRSFVESSVVLGTPVIATSDLSFHSFMSGVRFSVRTPRVVPFAQALVGLGRARLHIDDVTFGGQPIEVDESASVSAWLIDLGGGVNVNLSRHLAVRVSVSYLRDKSDDAEDGNSLRVGAGVVIPF